MPRLIDADALADELAVLIERNRKLIDEWFANLIEDAVDDAPTVDAEPVRHGRWINDFSSPLKCSSCGIESKANEITLRTDFKYCPYCGAKMDEVEDG